MNKILSKLSIYVFLLASVAITSLPSWAHGSLFSTQTSFIHMNDNGLIIIDQFPETSREWRNLATQIKSLDLDYFDSGLFQKYLDISLCLLSEYGHELSDMDFCGEYICKYSTNVSIDDFNVYEAVNGALGMLNACRMLEGKPIVLFSEDLTRSALLHFIRSECYGTYSHTINGLSWYEARGLVIENSYSKYGQNLMVSGYFPRGYTPRDCACGIASQAYLMGSAGHRKTALNDYDYVGIYVAPVMASYFCSRDEGGGLEFIFESYYQYIQLVEEFGK